MRKFLFLFAITFVSAIMAKSQIDIPPNYDSTIIFFENEPESKSIDEFSDGLLKKKINYHWDKISGKWKQSAYGAERVYDYDKNGRLVSVTDWNIVYNAKKNVYDENDRFAGLRKNFFYNEKGQLIKIEIESRSDKKDKFQTSFKHTYEYEGENLMKEIVEEWMVNKMKKTSHIKSMSSYTTGGQYDVSKTKYTTTEIEYGVKGKKDWVTYLTTEYKYDSNEKATATTSSLDLTYYDNSLAYNKPGFLYKTETSVIAKNEIMQKLQADVVAPDVIYRGIISREGNRIIVAGRDNRKKIYYYNHRIN